MTLASRVALALGAILPIIPLCFAGENVWTPLGPYSSSFDQLTFHPTDDTLVFASGYSGVFRSSDAGQSWARLTVDPSATVYPAYVHLYIHPLDPRTVIAAGAAVYRSTDLGDTWSVIARPHSGVGLRTGVYDLAVDPFNPLVLYAAGRRGPDKSTDGGRTWQRLEVGLPGRWFAPQIEVDPYAPNILYLEQQDKPHLGARRFRLSKSTDAGATWFPAESGLGEQAVSALVVHPLQATVLYAAARTGLFKSTDRGTTWSQTACPSPPTFVAVHPRRLDTVLATDSLFIYKSTDGGTTWTRSRTGLALAQALGAIAIHPRQTELVFLASFGGILRSQDGGQTWRPVLRGPDGIGILDLEADPGQPGKLIATSGYSYTFSYVTRDGGESWHSLLQSDEERFDFQRVRVHPSNSNLLAAANYNFSGFPEGSAVVVSTDGGRTWAPKGNFENSDVVVWDPEDESTLYIAPWENRGFYYGLGVAKSTDLGATWSVSDEGLGGRKQISELVIDPNRRSVLYALAGNDVYKSVDGARSWRGIASDLPGYPVRLGLDPEHSRVLYLSTNNRYSISRLFKSTDGGDHWEQKSGFPTSFAYGVSFLKVTRSYPQQLFAGGFGGLYVSGDGGERWAAFDQTGIPERVGTAFTSLVLEPWEANSYLLGTWAGVFTYKGRPTLAP
jgi:photosystem II stability/assembly factor-like uncharacterized protein